MATGSRSNPLALAVLGCLFERPMHPYEVAQTLRQRAKHESIRLNYGSLYNVVEALEKRGLITARETLREGRRPERTIYQITEAGTREFNDWLTFLVAEPAKEYLQFEAALSLLAGLPPDEALAALNERSGKLMFRLSSLRATLKEMEASGHPRLFSLEAEYLVVLYEAELDWVHRLAKDIAGGSLEGIDSWQSWFAPSSGRAPPGG